MGHYICCVTRLHFNYGILSLIQHSRKPLYLISFTTAAAIASGKDDKGDNIDRGDAEGTDVDAQRFIIFFSFLVLGGLLSYIHVTSQQEWSL